MNLTGMAGRICPLLVLVHSSLLDCVYTGCDLACPLVHFVYVYSFISALWAHVPEGKKMFGIFGMQMLCNSLEARSYVCACVCMNECMYAWTELADLRLFLGQTCNLCFPVPNLQRTCAVLCAYIYSLQCLNVNVYASMRSVDLIATTHPPHTTPKPTTTPCGYSGGWADRSLPGNVFARRYDRPAGSCPTYCSAPPPSSPSQYHHRKLIFRAPGEGSKVV